MAWGDYFGGRGQQTPRVARGPGGADRAGPGDLGVNRGRQPGLFGSRGAAAMGAPSYVPSRTGNVRDAFNTGINRLKTPFIIGMERLGGVAKGLQKNQMQADWLKNTYFGGDTKARDLAYWNQAIDNKTGTDFGAAWNRLKKSGITRNDMEKFTGRVPSKWTGNEAWLRSQAHDTALFNDAMPHIKNAQATDTLYDDLQDRSFETMVEPGITGRPDLVDDVGYRSGIEEEGGGPFAYDVSPGVSSDPDEVFEDPFAPVGSYLDAGDLMPGSPVDTENLKRRAVFGNRKTGVRGMGPEEKFVRGFEYGDVFDDYDFGQAGMNDFAGMTGPYTTDEGDYIPGDTRNVINRGTGRVTPGRFDQFYMNRIGDIINRGPITSSGFIPNISVEFEDEDELLGPGSTNPRRFGG